MPWMCSRPCGALLGCEHPCRGTCGGCLQGWVCQQLGLGSAALPNLPTRQQGSTLVVQLPTGDRQLSLPAADQLRHAACRQVCGRSLFCGHSCEAQCHQGSGCPPCRRPCAVRCSHSACGRACGQACPPCAEPCAWECVHQVSMLLLLRVESVQRTPRWPGLFKLGLAPLRFLRMQGRCPMPCGAPCVRLPCDQRCALRLPCGCRCPGVCGERCPPPAFCPNHGSPRSMVRP